MGYYSSFSFNLDNVIVDKEKIKKVEKYFSDCEKEDVAGFYNVKLPVEKNAKGKLELKYIELDDYYQKFYDDRLFAEKLQGAIKEGAIRLSFVGEDGSTWGYKITPNEIIELDSVFVPAAFVSTYCKKCGAFVGYMEEKTFERLGKVCDTCAEKGAST